MLISTSSPTGGIPLDDLAGTVLVGAKAIRPAMLEPPRLRL